MFDLNVLNAVEQALRQMSAGVQLPVRVQHSEQPRQCPFNHAARQDVAA